MSTTAQGSDRLVFERALCDVAVRLYVLDALAICVPCRGNVERLPAFLRIQLRRGVIQSSR